MMGWENLKIYQPLKDKEKKELGTLFKKIMDLTLP